MGKGGESTEKPARDSAEKQARDSAEKPARDSAEKQVRDSAEKQAPTGYRVLARKYRPATFDDLIGQQAMVRTLTNAFASGRIAQAYMLTGVRGVGKTTTARIVARAWNYERADKADSPTVDMPALGVHCAAIMASRHPDVVEMDAASHTGIDDIREIIEAVRYRPISARYKVYIIDEVHMLSRQAFNGLLKTLEEPPDHVRFIFATTEVHKVPVTVLSRCQRFDLRRIESGELAALLAGVAEKEGAVLSRAALALIARAAEGSARDGLSLLDQAISLTVKTIDEPDIRAMLGLADRALVIDLFGAVMSGDAGTALAGLKALYDAGADPAAVLADMADFVHLVTRVKVTETSLVDPALSGTERDRAVEMAQRLSMAALARAWQMLLKGLGEVGAAPNPLAAADMVLVRMAYGADLPPPSEVIRALQESAGNPKPAQPASSSTPPTSTPPASAPAPVAETAPQQHAHPLPIPADFAAAAALVGDLDIRLAEAIESYLHPVSFETGRIEISLAPGAPGKLANQFAATLGRATGRVWVVSIVA
ncbi:MAG: DNA polymerase III subunit gamma/tau, partial [Hyphomicrobiales bacterium]